MINAVYLFTKIQLFEFLCKLIDFTIYPLDQPGPYIKIIDYEGGAGKYTHVLPSFVIN